MVLTLLKVGELSNPLPAAARPQEFRDQRWPEDVGQSCTFVFENILNHTNRHVPAAAMLVLTLERAARSSQRAGWQS